MAIQIGGTSVIDNDRKLLNISSFGNTVESSYGNLDVTISNRDLANRDYVVAGISNLSFTLPASPNPGNEVVVGTLSFFPLTINRNGKPIMGLAENLIIDFTSIIKLTFVNDILGWTIS